MYRLLILISFVFAVFISKANTIYVISVGICDYKYSTNDLSNTESDAKKIAELFAGQNVKTKTLLGSSATHDNILSAIRSHYSSATKDDVVVFFFSGHGTEGGLCSYDTYDNSSVVTYSEIQEAIRNCKALNKQLFIDACYSGGLRRKINRSSKQNNKKSPISNTEGIMLFLSSRDNETSQENRWGGHGFFTQYLLLGLKGEADSNKDKVVTAKEIFTYVSTKVAERTQNKQNPVMWGRFNDNMEIMTLNQK